MESGPGKSLAVAGSGWRPRRSKPAESRVTAAAPMPSPARKRRRLGPLLATVAVFLFSTGSSPWFELQCWVGFGFVCFWLIFSCTILPNTGRQSKADGTQLKLNRILYADSIFFKSDCFIFKVGDYRDVHGVSGGYFTLTGNDRAMVLVNREGNHGGFKVSAVSEIDDGAIVNQELTPAELLQACPGAGRCNLARPRRPANANPCPVPFRFSSFLTVRYLRTFGNC